MEKQKRVGNVSFVLKLKQIIDGLELRPSTAKYAAKNSGQIHDMPPEGVRGKPRLFTLSQATRFAAVVMLIRAGVRVDNAAMVIERVEGIVDAANRTEGNDSSVYRYSIGYQVDSGDPWKLTIRDDLVVEIDRKHAMELQDGAMLNLMTPFIVTSGEAAGDSEFDTPMSEFVLNLTQIENRLAGLNNAKS